MNKFDDILTDDEQEWANDDVKAWHEEMSRTKAECDVYSQVLEERAEEIKEREKREYKRNIKWRFEKYGKSQRIYGDKK